MKYVKTFTIKSNEKHSELAEAFGLFGEKDFKTVDVEIPDDYQLLYITGEFGGGKSTLLDMMGGDNVKTPEADALPIEINPSLDLLSAFGLSDARFFFTPFKFLSASQKERLRFVYTLASTDGEIRCDEFLSNLDRRTALAVAENFGKTLRRLGRRAIVVTAHDDLTTLGASHVVRFGAFPSRSVCSVASPVVRTEETYRHGMPSDWSKSPLAELHYRGKHTGGIKDVVFSIRKDETVAVRVIIHRMSDGGKRIARLVVHPTYRGLGIGKRLVQHVMRRHPGVDTVAAMAKYNPVFERAGMRHGGEVKVSPPPKFVKALAGFDKTRWMDFNYCAKWCKDANNRKILAEFASLFSRHIAPGGKRLGEKEISEKLLEDERTAARCLWQIRLKSLTKFVCSASSPSTKRQKS